MIERGREVGGGDIRTRVGTVARVVDIRALPDGRYALVAVGGERLRVNAWLPDDPYPLADVDLWPDDDLGDIDLDEVARARSRRLHARVRELNEEVRALGEMTPPPDAEIADDPHLALYHLGLAGAARPGRSAAHARGAHARRAAGRVRGRARRRRGSGPVSLGVIEPGPMSDPSPRPSTRRESASVGEVVEYVRDYAIQETVGPLKGAGRWIGFGAGGAALLGLGIMLLMLGLLRLIQSEWDGIAEGGTSWIPYAIVLRRHGAADRHHACCASTRRISTRRTR